MRRLAYFTTGALRSHDCERGTPRACATRVYEMRGQRNCEEAEGRMLGLGLRRPGFDTRFECAVENAVRSSRVIA